jgi:pyridoxamine 5'-phosphate oxidase
VHRGRGGGKRVGRVSEAGVSRGCDGAGGLPGVAAIEAGLRAAVADRGHGWRLPVLASVGPDGAAEGRILVLRGVGAVLGWLELHTDARSAKLGSLRRERRVALVFWDAASRLQVRVRGKVAVHAGDAVARGAWAALPAGSRRTYAQGDAPGGAVTGAPARDEAGAFAAFAVLRVGVEALDVLRVEPQVRAVWRRDDHGWVGGEVAP